MMTLRTIWAKPPGEGWLAVEVGTEPLKLVEVTRAKFEAGEFERWGMCDAGVMPWLTVLETTSAPH